jgi:gas vesicle protein
MALSRWSAMAAFVAGVGIGAVVGLLAAPESGEQLRGNIVDTVNNGLEKVKATTRKFANRARDIAEQAERVQNAIHAVGRVYREAKRSSA